MFLLAMGLLQVAHHHIFGDFPNTDEGMLVYHGTAALADMYLIYVASELLSGELSFQIQCLNLASIVTNAVGYFAYTQYVSHWFYDLTMLGVGCVLIYKLMRIPDHDSRHSGRALVSDFDRGFNQLHTSTTNP